MKKILLTLVSASIIGLSSAHAVSSITLTTFGSSMEADLLTYNSETSTITGTEVLGGVLYPGSFTPVNLTTLDNYGGDPTNLRLNLTGFATAPTTAGFFVTLEGGLGKYVSTSFNWNSFTTTSSTVSVPVNVDGADAGFEWNNIVGFTWDSGGSGAAINATYTNLTVTAVPEPSTYALMALGGLVMFYMIRRRKAQA
jgi:hypothetical protein